MSLIYQLQNRIANPADLVEPWSKRILSAHWFTQNLSFSGFECVSCNKIKLFFSPLQNKNIDFLLVLPLSKYKENIRTQP